MEILATLVVPDNTTVAIHSFTLKLSTGITLRFSEAINVSTLG